MDGSAFGAHCTVSRLIFLFNFFEIFTPIFFSEILELILLKNPNFQFHTNSLNGTFARALYIENFFMTTIFNITDENMHYKYLNIVIFLISVSKINN